MTKRIAIYIPGLGDKRRGLLWAQRTLLRTWRPYGFLTRIFTVDWASGEPFETRFNELLQEIDKLHAEGVEVSLIGTSAGASTAILALVERPDKVTGVAIICGQIAPENALGGPAARVNPRFRESLEYRQVADQALTPALRQRILTLRPRADAIVPIEEALLSGATNYRMPISGHLLGIGFAILAEGYRITKFLKRLSV